MSVILIDGKNRILLAKHSESNKWVLPGGSVEPNESPADAAVREMWEETGLFVKPLRVMGVYGGEEFQITYSNKDIVSYTMIAFECHLIRGKMRADCEEILDVAYFSKSALLELEKPPWMNFVLSDIYNQGGSITRFRPPSWKPKKLNILS